MSAEPHPAALPPPLVMNNLIFGSFISQAIHVAARYRLADRLADGPLTVAELAQAAEVQEQPLRRVLRLLASVGIFAHAADGRVELTPLAATLRTNTPGSMHDMALMMGWSKYWSAVGDLPATLTTGEPAFQRLWGVGLYEHCASHPEDAEIFNNAMTGFAGPSAAAVAAAYDFAPIKLLVDVAGGHGTYMATFLKANPALRGILFDQAHVVDGARQALDAAGVGERCEVVAGDFFKTVPSGGDAYVLEDIIHNWSDADATAILRNVHSAMAADGKLLLVELVLPAGDQPFFGKQLDVVMLTLFEGGRERTEAEFRELLAGCGFELIRIVPTHSLVSVVEARRI